MTSQPNKTKLVTVGQAARIARVSIATIRAWVADGTLRIMQLETKDLIPTADIPIAKHDRPEFRRFANLAGVGISITDAAARYALEPRTIRNWIRRGHIPVIGRGHDARVKLLDEQHIAYCAMIHHARGGPGRRTFAPDGTPYRPRRPG